ncbi:MAG: hypothetical protein RL701_270 [Pseudomonadota bacterium]|jgi:N-acetyl-anhydromuramyl-L-alanine amidase AmpD
MATLDKVGMLVDPRINQRRYVGLEHGPLAQINAIVVHQTDSPSEQATFNSYVSSNNGAHFLIGKGGAIYQTASVKMCCYHVGRLLKSRCLALGRANCSDPNYLNVKISSFNFINIVERKKPYPERYPVNTDSVGIELVGKHVSPTKYEGVTVSQNASLRWLIGELSKLFQLGSEDDVFRHPEVSYKNPGEAAGAKWK